jgi:hypothetical protein
MTKPTTIEEVLDDFFPVEHIDSDFMTCDSLYYECSYRGMKTSKGKTVRRFADGLFCIAKSYGGWYKECRHPREFWKPGKCNCGELKARKKALATIEQLVLERVIGDNGECYCSPQLIGTCTDCEWNELRAEQRQAIKQLLRGNEND